MQTSQVISSSIPHIKPNGFLYAFTLKNKKIYGMIRTSYLGGDFMKWYIKRMPNVILFVIDNYISKLWISYNEFFFICQVFFTIFIDFL